MKQYIGKVMKGNRVTIPKDIVEQLKLDKIQWIALWVEDGKIFLQPCEIVPTGI